MRNKLLATALFASAFTSPALAQQMDRVLTIYGTDRCPTNSSGEEIVVCARRPEGERYRIPKELRTSPEIAPNNQSWAARAEGLTAVGASTGTGTCSAVGSAGQTGCFAQRARAAKAERKANAQVERTQP